MGFTDEITIQVEKTNIDGYSGFISSDEFIAYLRAGTVISSKEEYIVSVRVWWSNRYSNEVLEKS